MFKKRTYSWKDGKELHFDNNTLVMAIMNSIRSARSGEDTPLAEQAKVEVCRLQEEGAHIIDLGILHGQTSADPRTAKEEMAALEAFLPAMVEVSQVPIAIDTFHSETAHYALSQGAHIINDMWGLRYDKEMVSVLAEHKVPVIIMHNQEEGKYGDIMDDLKAFFYRSIDIAIKGGIHPYNIWIDPGIGFAKDASQSMEVLGRLNELTILEYPLVLGTSRKDFIGDILDGLPPEERDEGTTATCIIGSLTGVDIVRVHNAKMVSRALKVANALLQGLT